MATLGNILLKDGATYRGRLLIKAPKSVAGESAVREKLAESGAVDVVFFSPSALPGDWPRDQLDDTSGMFSWTAFVQARYDSRLDRGEPPSDRAEVLGAWLYAAPNKPPPPVDPGLPPVRASRSPQPEGKGEAGLVVLGLAVGYFAVKRLATLVRK